MGDSGGGAFTAAAPQWLDKGDNAWQMTAATLVGLQSMPGLVILYASIVKKKWAVNSAFMALYAFAAVLLCWVILCFKMAFGDRLLPFWGKGGPAFDQGFLKEQAKIPESFRHSRNGTLEHGTEPRFPMASLVYFQFTFAAITTILVAGSVLGRMNIKAWMAFVPLWLVFCYTVGAFSLWGGGFLYHWGVIDYSGGYVIHLSSGVSGFVAAYWVGPRPKGDRERFPPNNVLMMLAGAGLLWMGWSGFNGGAPYAANVTASIAVLNTNVSAATSLLVWTFLDVFFFGKPSVIGSIQGMVTGLAVVTPGAGVVQTWAAIIMGVVSGSVPWASMMILHKKSSLLQKVDDTLAVFYTHAVAGLLGGIQTGLFAHPALCQLLLPVPNTRGAFYGGNGGILLLKQLAAAAFIAAWNAVSTSVILLVIKMFIPLRMADEELGIGDDAAHGEEAYALWGGDGERHDGTGNGSPSNQFEREEDPRYVPGARGVTIVL
ncbi:PREDICTED: ammonium transporter 2 [Tarenaya hassleriana]|uniref:ammonium transporter 2 n=1 Tax=Tarenaya hassleriana TaxID=28532 RepID=UPI00053C88E4|nr:PREDICTED: ammonium transporter 2 [Tarenaya hassleriana]